MTYIITFYDYDNDIIKHVYTSKRKAYKKHKELQASRAWGFYNIHEIKITI
jgi:hypothetical protein